MFWRETTPKKIHISNICTYIIYIDLPVKTSLDCLSCPWEAKTHSPPTPQGIACPKFSRVEANLEGAYFTSTILQAKNLKGAILTEALMPADVLQKLCEREDVILGTMFSQRESRMMFSLCVTPGNHMFFSTERVASQWNVCLSWKYKSGRDVRSHVIDHPHSPQHIFSLRQASEATKESIPCPWALESASRPKCSTENVVLSFPIFCIYKIFTRPRLGIDHNRSIYHMLIYRTFVLY